MRLYDGITFRVERDGPDGRPVASAPRPACWVLLANLEIQGVSGSEDFLILPGMTLSRTDVTNSAVTMIKVVPAHEVSGLGTGRIEVAEAFCRELGDRKSVV